MQSIYLALACLRNALRRIWPKFCTFSASLAGIKDVSVSLRPGAEKTTIAAWEQRHGVILPSGLKQLYLTSDGFSLTWNYVIGGILPFDLLS